jgi:hypothetical protein
MHAMWLLMTKGMGGASSIAWRKYYHWFIPFSNRFYRRTCAPKLSLNTVVCFYIHSARTHKALVHLRWYLSDHHMCNGVMACLDTLNLEGSETTRISANGTPNLSTSVVVPVGLPRAIPVSAMPKSIQKDKNSKVEYNIYFITLLRVHLFGTCRVQVHQDWIKHK